MPVQRTRGRPVKLQECVEPFTGLRRDPWALQRGFTGGNEIELAASRDHGQLGQVNRAELDRWPGERPGNRATVGGVRERPQPGDRIPDLWRAKQGRAAGETDGHTTVLDRRADHRTVPVGVGHSNCNRLR